MSVNSQDIFDCSERIHRGASCEADHRAAIGRAYYACYHYAKKFHDGLKSPGIAPSHGGMHTELAHRLQNPTVTGANKVASKKIGYILQTLKINRIKADYRIDDPVSESDAETSVETARRLLTSN